MLDKYGDEVLRELEEENRIKKKNSIEYFWAGMAKNVLCIDDRTFKMTYTKLSDRSVETYEAYTGGESLQVSPLCF